LIARVSTTALTEELVEAIWRGVLAEPACIGRKASLSLSVVPSIRPIRVKAALTDIEDILGNLLRNAAVLALETGRGDLQVRWGVEEDPITASQKTAIRVADQLSAEITTEMIRSRYVAHGLGLVNQLAERLNGSVCVEAEPEFSKAIVVRLPIEEVV
jgi:sensor histidine kinase regulating citrate/malate metabolism